MGIGLIVVPWALTSAEPLVLPKESLWETASWGMLYGARLLGLGFALCPLPAVSLQGIYFHFLCLHLFIYKVGRSRILISGIEERIQWARSLCFQDQPSCMRSQSSCFPCLSIFCSLSWTIKFAIFPGTFHWHIYILLYLSLTYQLSGSFPIFSSLLLQSASKEISTSIPLPPIFFEIHS